MVGGPLSKKTKITIAITAIGVIGLIVALKYAKSKSSSSSLPQNSRSAGAGALGTDVPIQTSQAITEAAYNQTPSLIDDPIDSPSSEDTGVLTLS